MPYVRRNNLGTIEAVMETAEKEDQEFILADHQELQAFLKSLGVEDDVLKTLVHTDLEMSRVVEDLVDAMIRKNQLLLTDLPLEAQQKLMKRQKLRGQLNGLVGLIDEDDVL